MKKTKKTAAHRFVSPHASQMPRSLCRPLCSLVPLLAAGLICSNAAARPAVSTPAANALPQPSSNAAKPFLYRGAATVATSGNAMTITQNTALLGLNWDRFDIGAGASVEFKQPDAMSRALNRIWSGDPSVIMGQLKANGSVYLINPNGIVFGNGSRVNVGGLTASALAIGDELLDRGLPGAAGESLGFAYTGSVADFDKGFVAVDAGARITTPSGSRVVLLAPKTVENLGRIEGGAGAEAILAAGGSVVLTAPADPNLRGLLVEVKSAQGTDSLGNRVTLDGSVTHRADGSVNADGQANGAIVMPQGTVSLAALAVNQQGAITANKAVNLNGQIMLVSGSQDTQRLTVTQTGDKALIDWQSGFNVEAGKTVEFIQPGAGAIAWNFINDADRKLADGSALDQAGRSRIDGTLIANGQLALINEKGIAFGGTARVSAGNFIASALGVNSEVVDKGLLSIVNPSLATFSLFKTDSDASTAAEFNSAADAALLLFRESRIDVAVGAQIATGENGFAVLAGGKVSQAGNISTPGGQTVLAAGSKVYLKPPYSQVLRGFTAEVDPLYIVDSDGWNGSNPYRRAISRGADSNRIVQTGRIDATFGNITLAAHDIYQGGTLHTSTSVTRNGSIRLLARDMVTDSVFKRKIDNVTGQVIASDVTTPPQYSEEEFVVGQQGGTLTLGTGSRTEVVLDGSDGKTITAGQAFTRSSIEAAAAKINVEDRAVVDARAGTISLTAYAYVAPVDAVPEVPAVPATETTLEIPAVPAIPGVAEQASFDNNVAFAVDKPSLPTTATPMPGAGVFIGSSAQISAGGVTANKSVADLFIDVELRGDEFAGNPVQRNNPALRGKKVRVDVRDKVAIADITGYIAQMGQSLEERAATGGDISVRSSASVIVKADAVLDVSGGSVDYAAAMISESRLRAGGAKSYRLNDAPIDLPYTQIITTSPRLERFYREGRSAGSIEFSGNSLAIGGTLTANTVRGERQRSVGGDPTTDRTVVPLGGKLIVRDAGQHYQPAPELVANAGSSAAAAAALAAAQASAYATPQIRFVAGAATDANGLGSNDIAGPRLDLSVPMLTAGGFSRFDIASDGRLEIPAGTRLDLAPGGAFKATARQILVGGGIYAPNGSIDLSTRDLSGFIGNGYAVDAKHSTLMVDSGAVLSTAGSWVNDFLVRDPSGFRILAINGGASGRTSINLSSAGDLDLRAGSLIDVSGGGRVRSDGKLDSGNAGSIKLASGGVYLDAQKPEIPWFELLFSDRRDSSVFLDGTLAGYALGKGGTLDIATSKIVFGSTFAADSRNWTRAQRLAAGQVGAAFAADFLDRGGFFDFRFTGRDGLTVADKLTLAPNPLSWSLLNVPLADYLRQVSGTPIERFARIRRLPPELRAAATAMTLKTSGVAFGDLSIGNGATVAVDPLGSITLESWRQMDILGTLAAPGGTIRLARPASTHDNPLEMDYTKDEELQSRSIFLGASSRLLAGGTARTDATTAAYLDSGRSVASLSADGFYRGTVLAGGAVDIDAGQGYLISRPGSLVDVNGSSGAFDFAVAGNGGPLVYSRQAVGSAGGRVSLSAREGMFLDGDYQAAGQGAAPGGIFSLRFTEGMGQSGGWGSLDGIDDATKAALGGARQLTLFQSAGARATQWPDVISPDNYLAGAANIDPLIYNGKARLDLAPLARAGFGSWYLQSQDEIRFDGSINAAVANQLRLDGKTFSAVSGATDVTLSAAAIQVGNFGGQSSGTPLSGGAKFTAEARDLALVGSFAWSGFASSKFASRGELHFDSMPHKVAKAGGGEVDVFDGVLKGAGAFELSAARLIPSTYSHYTVDLSGDAASSIRLTRPNNAETLAGPLSVGGELNLKAHEISHRGTIAAPLGSIAFVADGGTVSLGADSITSVAAEASLMLGQTSQSGRLWEFLATTLNPTERTASTTPLTVTAPEKRVRVDADRSIVETGAHIDLSGGGNAFAAELTPGPGGKVDILAASLDKEPTLFAILPSARGGFAPADLQNQAYYGFSNPRTGRNGSDTVYDPIPSLKPGDQIDLAANSTGVSGRYTLLPARFALLPGALLVSVKTTSDAILVRPQDQADGSTLVSAQRLAANADGSYTAYAQRALTVELAPQAVVMARANYILTDVASFADFYKKDGAQLPGDAGRLSVAGRQSLVFDPMVIGNYAAKIVTGDGRQRAGRGVQIDLAAPMLEIRDAGTAAAGGAWSSLDKDKLNALGASSLLLGGVRTTDATTGTTTIETIANSLRIATSGAQALQADEIMLDANGSGVVVENGSRLATTGKGASATSDIALTGDGAFVRIADGAQATVHRDGTLAHTGDLLVESGSSITGSALIFDATRDNRLDGNVGLADGGALSIGAGRINFVGTGSTSAPADGLVIDNAWLTGLGNPGELRLTSYSTIDLYGSGQIGSASLHNLILGAAGIAGHGAAGQTFSVQADSVRFDNPNPETASFTAGAALGGGKLDVAAQTVVFGGSATAAMRKVETPGFALRGFADVKIAATGELRFEGLGVTAVDNIGGSGAAALTIDAGRVAAAGSADHLLRASGAVTLAGGGNKAAATDFGGALDLRAASLDVSGRIDMPAGRLALTATGSGVNDNLTIHSGAVIAAEGATVAFLDTEAYAPGGSIKLRAEQKNLVIESGAIVSVNGGKGGDAGRLALQAEHGTVSAGAGTLRGSANAADPGVRQGELNVDARSVSLDALAAAVREPQAGGATQTHFTGRWDVRARQGDLALNDTIVARSVHLAADAGNIDIAGVIDASGPKGGEVALFANRGADGVGGHVDLRAGSVLRATATEKVDGGPGTSGRGGKVTVGVSATNAADEMATAITMAPGALIDVSVADGSKGEKGEVVFRVPRQDSLLDQLSATGAVIASNAAIAVLPAAYKVSPAFITSLAWGTTLTVKLPDANAGQVLLGVNSLGNKAVRKADGSALADSNLTTAGKVLVYDGSAWRVSPTASLAATPPTTTGSATAYSVAAPTGVSALGAAVAVAFKAHVANASGVTLKVGSLAAKPLWKADGSGPVAGGSVALNQQLVAVYDPTLGGGVFRLSPTTPANAAAAQTAPGTSGVNYQIADSAPTAAYQKGMLVSFTAQADAKVAAKLKIGSLADQSLLRADGTAIVAGDFKKGQGVVAVYDGTSFRVASTALADSGTASDYKASFATVPTLYSGMVVAFRANNANAAGPLTLQLNGQSTLKKVLLAADGTSLAANAIAKDQLVTAVYDGSAFRVVNDTGLLAMRMVDETKSSKVASLTLAGNVSGAGQVALEGVRTMRTAGDLAIDANRLSFLMQESRGLEASVPAILAAADPAARLGMRFRNGLEFSAGRDITVATDWDLATLRTGGISGLLGTGDAGTLTVRAGGNLNINGTLSDGFGPSGSFKGIDRDAALLGALPGSSGIASAYKVPGSLALNAGAAVLFKAHVDNAAEPTLAVGSGLTKPLRNSDGSPLAAGAIAKGQLLLAVYDAASGAFRLATPPRVQDSWSYRLVAGAVAGAADPLAVALAAGGVAVGNIDVAANKLVRTGSGSISLAASQDIRLFDRAAVFTAGVVDVDHPDGFTKPVGSGGMPGPSGTNANSHNAVFAVNGGDLALRAGQDILMDHVDKDKKPLVQRHINQWMFRAGVARDEQWWPRIASFQQGVAAFGGGDITVDAGGNISNMTLAIPTSGRVPTLDGESQPDLAKVRGGGDMSVHAGKAIIGGLFYAASGQMRIDADTLEATKPTSTTVAPSSPGIAIGNTAVRVTSRGDAELGNVFDPLWVSAGSQSYVFNSVTGTTPFTGNLDEYEIRLGSYGAASSLNLASVAGTVTLNSKNSFYGIADAETHTLAPARVKVAALKGDITVAGDGLSQVPGAAVQLDVLAGGAIRLDKPITQLDVPDSALPSVRNPLQDPDTGFKLWSLADEKSSAAAKHSTNPWRENDSEASRLVALGGDLLGPGLNEFGNSQFNEPVHVHAAGDVRDLSFTAQHSHGDDLSTVTAHGDIRFSNKELKADKDPLTGKPKYDPLKGEIFNAARFQINGPGLLEVIAEGSVDLANRGGIVTRGNLENPNLPEGGASVFVLAGATQPDYAGFLDYLAGTASASVVGDFASQLAVFIDLHPEFRNGAAPSMAQNKAALLAMPAGLREPFLRNQFYTVLRDAGREAVASGLKSHYDSGREAVAALFPQGSVNGGNIDFYYSQIKTEQGGSIDLLAPGGSITVGIANPSDDLAKKASEQGLFTVRGGDIRAFLSDNFLVNQSRVFTLDGGDIMIWADKGNIDAGSGAKTVSSTPPPALVIRNGQIVLDTSNSVAGSGIGTLLSRDTTPPSDLDLFAPQGAIDAGDAGLRSSGNVNLGARVILNANNIQAAGTVAGAPVAPPAAVPPPALPSEPAAAGNRGDAAAQEAAARQGAERGILTVEVIDGGNEAAPPANSEDDAEKKKKESPAKG